MAEMANNRLNSSDFKENELNRIRRSNQSWIFNENELTKYQNEIIKALPVMMELAGSKKIA